MYPRHAVCSLLVSCFALDERTRKKKKKKNDSKKTSPESSGKWGLKRKGGQQLDGLEAAMKSIF